MRIKRGYRTVSATHCRNGHRRMHTYVTRTGAKVCRICQKRVNNRRKAKRHRESRILASEFVPNAGLRGLAVHQVESGQLTWGDLARAAGFMSNRRDGRHVADTIRVKRALGVSSSLHSNGFRYTQRRLHHDTAVEIMHALGVDPWEVGL